VTRSGPAVAYGPAGPNQGQGLLEQALGWLASYSERPAPPTEAPPACAGAE
jgi:hypothetical protein